MKKLAITSLLILTTTLSLTPSANAALQGRLATTSGGTDYQAYYDTTLNITWLANANLAASNQFGLNLSTNTVDLRDDYVSLDGSMTWAATNQWLSNLNSANYLGFNTWRLPTLGRDLSYGELVSNFDIGGCKIASYDGSSNCGWNVLTTDPKTGDSATNVSDLTVYSEMASLYFDTLGNRSVFDTAGNVVKINNNLEVSGPFTDIKHSGAPDRYWLGLQDSTSNNSAWTFAFGPGLQQTVLKTHSLNVMVVIDGDIAKLNTTSTIPEPETFVMLGLGVVMVRLASKRMRV